MLVTSYIKRHQTIEPNLIDSWRQCLTVAVQNPQTVHDIDLLSAQGELSSARFYGEQMASKVSEENTAQCLTDLGQVYLDMGNHTRASIVLADATTMSTLQNTPKSICARRHLGDVRRWSSINRLPSEPCTLWIDSRIGSSQRSLGSNCLAVVTWGFG